MRFLLAKKYKASSSAAMSPSSKLDQLLHWLLLNTDARKTVEEVVGEISHSEDSAEDVDELKVQRR